MAAFKPLPPTLAPSGTVTLPPAGFADTYEGRPDEPVVIGVRRLSEATVMQARAVAVRQVERTHGNYELQNEVQRDVWVEAYNNALMHWLIAHATCRADDATQPYWEMAPDVVPIALSTGGTLRLFEAIEALMIADGVLSPELDVEGTQRLAEGLLDGSLCEGLTERRKRQVSRLLARALELCGQLDEADLEPTGIVADPG